MPFFGGKKVKVFSNTVSLFTEESGGLGDEVLFAVLNNVSIPDTILAFQQMKTNISSLLKYYTYARDEYYLGLPEGQVGELSAINIDELKAAILRDTGDVVTTFEVATMMPLNPAVAMFPYLAEVRGADVFGTMKCSNPPPIFDLNVIDQTEGIFVYDIWLNPDGISCKIGYFGIIPTTDIMVRPDEIVYAYEDVALPADIVIGDMYAIGVYYTAASPTIVSWWFYNIDSNEFPELNVTYDTISGSDTFMPVIPLRYDNEDLTNPNSPRFVQAQYDSSKKLLDLTGLSIDDMATEINENRDIDEVDHAYVTHCIDLNNTTDVGYLYIAIFLQMLEGAAHFDKADYLLSREKKGLPKLNAYNYQAADEFDSDDGSFALDEYGLHLSLKYHYISSRERRGNMGDIGKVSIATRKVEVPFDFLNGDAALYYMGPEYDFFVEFTYQKTKTIQVVVEACNLTFSNRIYRHWAVHVSAFDSFTSADAAEKHNFLFPIHYGLLQSSLFTNFQKVDLYERSLLLVVNSIVITRTPWYGQVWFAVVRIIISVIIIVYTWGGGTPLVLAANATLNVVLNVLLQIVIGLAVKMALQYLAKALGPEYAALLAIVAIVVSVAISISGGGLDASVGGSSFITAGMLLQTSIAFLDASGFESNRLSGKIAEESKEFAETSEKEMEELNAKVEALSFGPAFDVTRLLEEANLLKLSWESPEYYYNRTIHTGNIGVLVKDIPNMFYQLAYELPHPDYYSEKELIRDGEGRNELLINT